MGCNYYWLNEENKCDCCGGGVEEIHLGKSSTGWKFTFNYNNGKYYKSFEDLKECIS